MSKNPSKTIRREYTRVFYQGNRLTLALDISCTVLTAAGNLLISWLLQQIIDVATGLDTGWSLGALAGMCGLCLAGLLVCYGLAYVSEPRFLAKAMSQYKEYVFTRLTDKSISAFSRERSALYLSALSNDAAVIETDYLKSLPELVQNVVLFAGAFVMMFWYSPALTLVSVALALLPVLASVVTGDRLSRAEVTVSHKNEQYLATLKDSLAGFSVMKSFRAEKAMRALLSRSIRDSEQSKRSRNQLNLVIQCLGTCAGLIAQFGVFMMGAYLAMSGRGVTAGVVIVFVQLMNYVLSPIGRIPELLAKRKAAVCLIDKLAAALAENTEPDRSTSKPKLENAIVLEDVSFGYEGENIVLRNISARFDKGKSYAIVGASGSGKSTLLNLLMASHSGYTGAIRLDETELRDIRTESLYDLISIVQQNVFVFNATLRDNVTMFQSFPDEDVNRALELSGLARLIGEKGEDYLCGENGSGLSGGEKQRLSIARSLLRRGQVLLLDEATAALDTQTTSQVLGAVLELEGLTRIVVTHSLDAGLLRRCDAILTLKDGRLLESGTFDELMEAKGYFYSLYNVSQ